MVDGRDAAKTQKALRFDLRAYAYDGAVRWVAARIYQGQTTDFRTPCGSFSPLQHGRCVGPDTTCLR